MIKKLLSRMAFAGATLAVVVAGAAAFSAFEAHVVNVTATINNALTVPQEATGISFGNIFPEQVAHMPLNVSLSTSFVNEPSVDDISYMIRQKPKCQSNDLNAAIQHPQVTEQGVVFVCPAGSHLMPLLCPYLSKHLVVGQCNPNLPIGTAGACTGIDAFHGDINNWTEDTTVATQVTGHLVKGGDVSDNWDIDLHAPCFKGMCAQDNVVPAAYQPDSTLEGQTFGCDLWVEVNGISTTSETGTLTVTKVVVGGTKTVANFPLFVDGTSVTSGVASTQTATSHQVTETTDPDYQGVFSGNCGSTGLVTVPAGGSAACTLTNTFTPRSGILTVIKHVVNDGGGTATAGQFTINIPAGTPNSVTGSEAGTNVSVPGGTAYTVTEASGGPAGYITTYSTDCSGTMPAAGTATCTVTNTWQFTTTLTVNKVVVPSSDTGLFNLQIDSATAGTGANVGNGGTTGSVVVTAASHTVGETAGTATSLANYTTVIGGDCTVNGSITLAAGDHKVCTITNTRNTGSIKVHKVVSDPGQVSTQTADQFQMQIDGVSVAQDTVIPETTGNHTISEVDNKGDAVSFSVSCPAGVASVTTGNETDCTVTNTVPFARITVTKVVNNIHGGTAVVSNFTLFVGTTSVTSGTLKNFAPGTYTIAEGGVRGYQGVFSGACNGVNSVTLNAGDNVTCTITNTDIAPTITLVKQVTGGTAAIQDFTMFIDGAFVPSGSSLSVTSNAAHAISETADAGGAGYTNTAVVGTSAFGVSCPGAPLPGNLTLTPGDSIVCTITNNHP
jgi:hypothetical protein